MVNQYTYFVVATSKDCPRHVHLEKVIGNGKQPVGPMDAISTATQLDTRIKKCTLINIIVPMPKYEAKLWEGNASSKNSWNQCRWQERQEDTVKPRLKTHFLSQLPAIKTKKNLNQGAPQMYKFKGGCIVYAAGPPKKWCSTPVDCQRAVCCCCCCCCVDMDRFLPSAYRGRRPLSPRGAPLLSQREREERRVQRNPVPSFEDCAFVHS